MAIGDRLYIADKETLDEVKTTLGESSNPESENPTTIFSGIKNIVNNIKTLLDNVNSLTQYVQSMNESSFTTTVGVKKILSGIANGTSSVTHEEVNVSKSIVLIQSSTNYSASPIGQVPSGVLVLSRESTSFRITTLASSYMYYWQIIEFY